jgi:hypothetical protein
MEKLNIFDSNLTKQDRLVLEDLASDVKDFSTARQGASNGEGKGKFGL